MPLQHFPIGLARACLWLTLVSPAIADSPVSWRDVPPTERAENAPRIDAGAPAEVLFWRIDVDDRDFPRLRRKTEYIRFKVFDPEKAADCTRISRLVYSTGNYTDDEVEIAARLTLPDGTERIFGREALMVRDLQREGAVDTWSGRTFGKTGNGLKEKFLAIAGVVPGAVIDFQIRETDRKPSEFSLQPGQRKLTPVRHFEYCQRSRSSQDYAADQFVLNRNDAKISQDPKAQTITVTADALPALQEEPSCGALYDCAFAIGSAYTSLNLRLVAEGAEGVSVTFDDKAGPWSPHATIWATVADSLSEPTRKIRALAEQLTANAATNMEKAHRLHDFTQARYQRFLELPRPDATKTHRAGLADLLDDAEVQQVYADRNAFIWLELALARATNVPARLLLISNRKLRTFDPRLVCFHFLKDFAIGYPEGDRWHVSFPVDDVPRPFDQLPWQHENAIALIAEPNQQKFIQLPPAVSAASEIRNLGVFRLTATGQLTGECRTYYTGHYAAAIRSQLRRKTDEEQRVYLAKSLRESLGIGNVVIKSVAGVAEIENPVEINYTVEVPDFGAVAGDHLVLKPSFFHQHEEPEFSTEKRLYPVRFQFRGRVIDRFAIQLPRGYEPEIRQPDSHPGSQLQHVATISYRPEKRALEYNRTWERNLQGVSVDAYPNLRAWSLGVAEADRMDLILVKAASPAAEAPPPSTPTADSAPRQGA